MSLVQYHTPALRNGYHDQVFQDPRSRDNFDFGFYVDYDKMGPFLLSGRIPTQEYGLQTRYSTRVSISPDPTPVTWICCGKDAKHPGCWKSSQKGQIQRYNALKGIRSTVPQNVAFVNNFDALWGVQQVGTPWLDYDYYQRLHDQIQSLKADQNLKNFVQGVMRTGQGLDQNRDQFIKLAALYAYESEYNEVHGERRLAGRAFKERDWLQHIGKDLKLVTEPVVSPTIYVAPWVPPVTDKTKQKLQQALQYFGMDFLALNVMFTTLVQAVDTEQQGQALMARLDAVQANVFTIRRFAETNKDLAVVREMKQLATEQEVEQYVRQLGARPKIAPPAPRPAPTAPPVTVPSTPAPTAPPASTPAPIILDFSRFQAEINGIPLGLANLLQGKANAANTQADVDRVTAEAVQVRQQLDEVSQIAGTLPAASRLRTEILANVPNLTTEDQLQQLLLDTRRTSIEFRNSVAAVNNLPTNYRNALQDSQNGLADADTLRELVQNIRNLQTELQTLAPRVEPFVLRDLNAKVPIVTVLQRIRQSRAVVPSTNGIATRISDDLRNLLPHTEAKGFGQTRFNLEWCNNSCWLDSMFTALFSFQNTLLVSDVVNANQLYLRQQVRKYGIDTISEESCDANVYQRAMLTDIFALQRGTVEKQASMRLLFDSQCVKEQVRDDTMADATGTYFSLKTMYGPQWNHIDDVTLLGLGEDLPTQKTYLMVFAGDETIPLPLQLQQNGKTFVRISLIASYRPGVNAYHFVTFLHHPQENTTKLVNFNNGVRMVKDLPQWMESPRDMVDQVQPPELYVNYRDANESKNDIRIPYVGRAALYIDQDQVEQELGQPRTVEQDDFKPWTLVDPWLSLIRPDQSNRVELFATQERTLAQNATDAKERQYHRNNARFAALNLRNKEAPPAVVVKQPTDETQGMWPLTAEYLQQLDDDEANRIELYQQQAQDNLATTGSAFYRDRLRIASLNLRK